MPEAFGLYLIWVRPKRPNYSKWNNTTSIEVEAKLRLTVSMLGCWAHSGTCDHILLSVWKFLCEICGLVSVGRPLWREDGSAICSVITQWSESRRTRNHTLLSHLRLPNLDGQVPVFISPRKRVAQLYIWWGEVLLYDWRSVSQYVLVSSSLVRLATRYYFLAECCCLKFAVLFLWGTLSVERTGLQFGVQILNGPSRSEPVTILYCLI
jgi:hypothetical protein